MFGRSVEAERLVHLPASVRFLAVALLAVTLAAAIGVSLQLVLSDAGSDWILVSMSVAQIAASSLVVAIVLFFTSSKAPASALRNASRIFLNDTLPGVVAGIRLPKPGEVYGSLRVRLETLELQATAATYRASVQTPTKGKITALMHVFQGVARTEVFFYAPALQETGFAEAREALTDARFRELFAYEIANTERRGFELGVSRSIEEGVEGETIVMSLWRSHDADFITSPEQKLALGQDIAQILRSMLLTATRNGLILDRAPERA